MMRQVHRYDEAGMMRYDESGTGGHTVTGMMRQVHKQIIREEDIGGLSNGTLALKVMFFFPSQR